MSGGVLVAVDRLGRSIRRFPVTHGLATIGRTSDNDIRIIFPEVASHHATILIHDAQAVIRSTGGGVTLVNGRAVSVAALSHGDEISVGGRALRWEYSRPRSAPPRATNPLDRSVTAARRARGSRERRSAPSVGNARERAVQLALEMAHRNSLPGSTGGSTGGKQVAIVQPQRRDAGDHTERTPARSSPLTTRRSNYEPSTSVETEDKYKRKSASRTSPKNEFQNTTKATLWIESRKTSPRRKVQTPPQLPPPRRSLPVKKDTPLRMTVLKKAQSASKARGVIKIEAPLKIDHTKQAAIMLMTGHTPKSKLSVTPKNKSSSKSPSYLVKKPSPVRKTPRGSSGRPSRGSKSTGGIGLTPTRGSGFVPANRRSSKRYTSDRTVSILEISESTQNSTGRTSNASRKSAQNSPSLPSPKKSAMRDQSKKSLRKTESIKFDLSNLEHPKENDVMDSTSGSEDSEDIILTYSESSAQSPSPSPRRSIHSRSARLLEQVGTPLPTPLSPARTLTVESPSARRSLRGNAMVQKALEISAASSDISANTILSDRSRLELGATVASNRSRSDFSATLSPDRTRSRISANTIASDRTRSDLSASLSSDRARSRISAIADPDRTRSDLSSSFSSDRDRSRRSANTTASDRTKSRESANATVASAFRTRTLSPRHNLELYSVVDLVSFDSEDATKSVYASAGSTNTTTFGTPAGSRKTRSTIDPVLLGSSTPYPGRTRATRSKSSSNTTQKERVSVLSRRSKSLTTPENGQPVVVTRAHRPSRSRSRIHDDLSLLDLTEPDDSSPKTSKRSRINVSETIDITNVHDKTEVGITTPENRHSPDAEGTPVLSIRSLLDSSRGSFVSTAKDCEERETTGQARRSRLRLSQEPAGSEDEGTVTPISVAKPSPVSVKNKHSTAKKPQSKRAIIDDFNHSDIVKQLFVSPVKRKLTQSMSEYSRKRLFEDEDEIQVTRPTRRTLATGTSAPLLVTNDANNKKKGKRQLIKNDLTSVRGVKKMFRKQHKDDLRRVTGVGKLFKKTSPKNDLTDVRGVRKMFQQKSPINDLSNVSGVKRILRASPKNDLTDVRGVRRMFKEKKQKSYQDVSGVEELFQSRDRSTDAEELFDEWVGRKPIKAVYSRTFSGRAAQLSKSRRRSLRVSIDATNVEEWLEEQLKKRLPSSDATSRRISMELKKLATDTVEGSSPVLTRRTRNSSMKSTSTIRGNTSTKKQFPVPMSPTRSRRPVQRAVHSTPLKGRLQITMNASELGRVSPIAGPSRENITQIDQDVSISNQSEAEETLVRTEVRPPRKQKTESNRIEKIESMSKSPEKSKKRTSGNRKVETSTANTKRRRSSLVVSKKAPVICPKVEKALTSPQQSPKAGTSRRRTRAVKMAVVIAKPSPKLNPRSRTKTAKSSETGSVKLTTRKVAEKKPESPKVSPKRKTRQRTRTRHANASENEPQTKAKRTKVENLASLEEPSQPKRARRGNAAAASLIEENQPKSRGRKAQNQSSVQPEIKKKQPNRRGRNAESQSTIEPEIKDTRPNNRVKKAQNQTAAEPVTQENKKSTRGRKAQNETTVEPQIEEKRPYSRGRKAQNQIVTEPVQEDKKSNTRGRRAQNKTSVEPEEEKRPNRGRTAQNQTLPFDFVLFEPVIEETRTIIRGRRARNHNSETVEEKQPNVRVKKAQNQTVPQHVVEEKRATRGRKAQTQTSVQSETEEKKSNARGKKVQFDIDIENLSPRRGKKNQEIKPKNRGNKSQSPSEQSQPTRGRRAKPDITITETRRGKRKAAEEDLSNAIPPKRGKSTETPAQKSAAKQKATISIGDKAENSKKESIKKKEPAKPVRATKTKAFEELVKIKTTRRGRKAAEPKEKVVESTRGKRKANVDPSPAKAGGKRAAKEGTKPAPAPRARRAVAAKSVPEVATRAVRGRKR